MLLNLYFVEEVTSQIIKLSHIVRSTNHECIQMERRLQHNVLRTENELGNTFKVHKVDEIGKLDRSQTHVRITPKINSYLRKLQRCPFSISTVTTIMTRMHSGEKSPNYNDEDARMSIH